MNSRKKIIITGGSGLIGTTLKRMLEERNYEVGVLTRERRENGFYVWNPEKGEIEEDALKGTNFIIHLAGENIGEKRWSKERKKSILESRVKTLILIYDKLMEKGGKPSALISASAVGYYGSITSEKIFKEDDEPGNDFLAYVCKKWEESAEKFSNLGIRVVRIRTGVVLSPKGGALERFKTQAKLGFLFPLGGGKQYFPWIHIEDLCRIYIKALEDENMVGAYNATAPEYITNREFVKALASFLKKPFIPVGVPAFLIKLILGERADFILKGSRISSEKIISTGFDFKFKNIKSALNNLISSQKAV